MALVRYDLVQEQTSTGGTGTFTLAGATAGHRSFSVIGNGNTCHYFARGSTFSEWEVGVGTYTASGTTLARTTILSSSNNGSAVSFTGTATVSNVLPASFLDAVYSAGGTDVPITDGGTGASNAASALTNLGGTTVGQAFFGLVNPSAITFPRINANNTVSSLSASDFRTAIGLGTLATQSGTFSGTSSGTNTGDQDLSSYVTLTGTQALTNKTLGNTDNASAVSVRGYITVTDGDTPGTATIKMRTTSGCGSAGSIDLSAGSGIFTNGGTIDTHGGSAAGAYGGGIRTYGNSVANSNGGAISTFGGTASNAAGGAISTYGGSAANTSGGNIYMYGGSASGAYGGTLNMSGTTLPGGAIETSEGGGSINTRGTGSIGLGASGTRTTLTGTATADRAISLPDASGALVVSGGELGTPSSGTLTNCTGYTDANLSTSDVATNDVSTSKHGFCPKAPNDTTKFLRGDATWQTVASGATNIWIPASAMIPRVTNGPGVNSSETSTNKVNYDTLDFDAATQEYAQFLQVMPSNYSGGTVTARFFWTAGSGSGTVQFQLAGRALADDDAIDTARGTAVGVSDTLIAAGDMHRTAATSAITIAGSPAANAAILFEVSRDVASDSLGVDARLLGVEVSF
jgi:hypothetical protein